MSRPRLLIALLTVATVAAAGCSLSQEHGYAQSPDGSLSFRYPAAWSDVGLEPRGAEWIAGIDGSSQPDQGNVDSPIIVEPFVVAGAFPLEARIRDQASLNSLRRMVLEERPNPVNEDDPGVRFLMDEPFIDDNGFEGYRLRFEIDSEDGPSVEDHLAVFTPDRNQIQRLWAICSTDCFNAHLGEIEAIFDSVRLRS